MSTALVTDAHPGWTDAVAALVPGAHVAVFADAEADVVGVQGRFAGLELRDALVVLRAGPRISLVLLFRKPVVESVTAQVMATGTGGINLGACRPETDEVITTHSRGITTASPATREKSIEGDETIFVIHFYDASGLHSSVVASESKVRAKAAKHSSEAPSLLYASLPSIRGRARQDVFDPNERSSRWPTNVLLVHGSTCESGCEPGCPILTLGDASRYFPRFKDQGEVRAWISTLVTPPTAG
jgi:hypothetical protein